ncbi:hypothetical protein O181_038070 [Austropuccinia psidii MF-1]|uniref:CCHC-type domain-containing protein n=1 Tax=Austropuccinia psidii MF-1 TaxID=1389203 RepID=A0A9Q3HDS5_9BASI|nr:hypothetical protein [Austropuccinia psidii MF-1]
MFNKDFNIPDEYISARLHSLFTKSAKKLYHKMRQDHGKHSSPWWKEQIISKLANDFWRFKMENSFEQAIFNIERDRLMSWFLKQKDRLTALHPDMSETMIHKRILRKCVSDLENAIRRICIEPFSTEDYINSTQDITTRTKIGRNWYKPPMDNKTIGKPIPKHNKPHAKAPFKCHKCGITSHLANTCPKKKRINEIEIDKVEDTKETNNVSLHDSDSAPSEEEVPHELSIGNIYVSFEVTELNTHLPQYSYEFMDLINVQDAEMQKSKPSRGKGYTGGASCITNITSKNVKKEKLGSDQLIEAQIGTELTLDIKEELIETLFQYREAFASDNKLLGAIKGHELEIIINVERLYPPLLRRPAYPASPRARETLESHINELMKLGAYRNIGHNEEVKVTTPVIITCHNDKSRMVGYFRAFNTYTIPDRSPFPRIHETLTQLSKAKFITSMDALKGFHQNVLTPHSRKLLRIIAHFGIYEYFRMPFGIKNAPSHYQRMINTISPHELSEGWLIIYIDDIIICSETWQFSLERLSLVLRKIFQVNMKISLNNVILGFMS